MVCDVHVAGAGFHNYAHAHIDDVLTLYGKIAPSDSLGELTSARQQ